MAVFFFVSKIRRHCRCSYSFVQITDRQFQPFNFSQSYYSGESESWKIVAPAGHSAEIKLTSYFIATCQPQTEKCKCHSLTVKDGECSNSSVIGKYCGNLEKPITLSSVSRYLRLEFQSNNEDYRDYFTASYAAGNANRQRDSRGTSQIFIFCDERQFCRLCSGVSRVQTCRRRREMTRFAVVWTSTGQQIFNLNFLSISKPSIPNEFQDELVHIVQAK